MFGASADNIRHSMDFICEHYLAERERERERVLNE